ncbi:MAG: hypothetical protein KAT34_11280 [Candidatus Aminicenantes bacterium]|nr:hypothetical protein [Candidatus Aminicenantes bacterium]
MCKIKNFSTFLFSVILILIVFLNLSQGLQAQGTYTISGQVLSTGGRGIDGVMIEFNDGGTPQYEYTAGGGFYSHTVGSGWTGTITPNDSCYSFTPSFASIGPVSGDTVQDFTGAPLTFTISGTVSDGTDPISGVKMTLSTGSYAVSGADGFYSLTVPCGWLGTLTPLKVGWEFTPSSVIFVEPVSENQVKDFVGTASSTEYTISGRVSDTTGRIGMDGVTISFFDGATVDTTITTGDGYYSYTVPAYWTGSVTPSLVGYSFTPPTKVVGPVQSNITQDFLAQFNKYTISGTVMDSQAKPIPAVTMTLSTGFTTQTNISGQYHFEVIHGWSGNLIPSKTGWSFNPVYRNYNSVIFDLNNEHFFGIKVKDQHAISGTVTSGGTALENVVLSGLPDNPATDASGFYSALVTRGWSGTVTPTLSGYTFKPSNRAYSNVKDDFVNENYEALVNEPPKVEIVSPPGNAFVSGEVVIETEASDSDGIDKVEIYIDDQKAAEYQNVQNTSAKVDPTDIVRVFEDNPLALQLDSYGNSYYIVPGKDGKIALVRQQDPAHREILLEGKMLISGWLVKPDGTVIVAGTTAATCERWIKSLSPKKDMTGVIEPWVDIKWNLGITEKENSELNIAVLLSNMGNTTFTCKYIWDTSLFDLGPHSVMAKAYDTKGMSSEDEITLTISSVKLHLQLERKTDKAWIIEKEYVKIDATIENPDSIPIVKYVIFRKAPAGEFTIIGEVPASQVQGASFTYNDTDIEQNKQYTYKVEALDENGIVVGASEEKVI